MIIGVVSGIGISIVVGICGKWIKLSRTKKQKYPVHLLKKEEQEYVAVHLLEAKNAVKICVKYVQQKYDLSIVKGIQIIIEKYISSFPESYDKKLFFTQISHIISFGKICRVYYSYIGSSIFCNSKGVISYVDENARNSNISFEKYSKEGKAFYYIAHDKKIQSNVQRDIPVNILCADEDRLLFSSGNEFWYLANYDLNHTNIIPQKLKGQFKKIEGLSVPEGQIALGGGIKGNYIYGAFGIPRDSHRAVQLKSLFRFSLQGDDPLIQFSPRGKSPICDIAHKVIPHPGSEDFLYLLDTKQQEKDHDLVHFPLTRLTLWNLKQKKVVFQVLESIFVDMDENCNHIVFLKSNNKGKKGDAQSVLHVIPLESRKKEKNISIAISPHSYRNHKLSPDGRFLFISSCISADEEKKYYLQAWHIDQDDTIHTMGKIELPTEVAAMEFSPDVKFLFVLTLHPEKEKVKGKIAVYNRVSFKGNNITPEATHEEICGRIRDVKNLNFKLFVSPDGRLVIAYPLKTRVLGNQEHLLISYIWPIFLISNDLKFEAFIKPCEKESAKTESFGA